ncbi:hypothetical protein C8R47DRAFT_1081337 [Mycena vitilis]|nr:hypothetical protein C8R47DRAFT_1081337 [Mycena vitilis]
MTQDDRLETAGNSSLMNISPSCTKLARRKALAQYRDNLFVQKQGRAGPKIPNSDGSVHWSICCPRNLLITALCADSHRAQLRQDPAALLKYQERAREASRNYEAKHREFRSWKRRLQRVEASYKRLGRDKRPEEKRTGTRDYKLEWEVYQEKQKEKERERLADAVYVPPDDTVRIERDDGSFRYIYKY